MPLDSIPYCLGGVLVSSNQYWECLPPGPDGAILTADRTAAQGVAWVSPAAAPTDAITSAADGATVTFDLSASNWHEVTLGGNRTLAPARVASGQEFTLLLKQDGTGSRTVTWWSGILWAGGAAPTLTTAAAGLDAIRFKQTGTGAYLGWVVGQAFA